jgi:hypothetical membrane protein
MRTVRRIAWYAFYAASGIGLVLVVVSIVGMALVGVHQVGPASLLPVFVAMFWIGIVPVLAFLVVWRLVSPLAEEWRDGHRWPAIVFAFFAGIAVLSAVVQLIRRPS